LDHTGSATALLNLHMLTSRSIDDREAAKPQIRGFWHAVALMFLEASEAFFAAFIAQPSLPQTTKAVSETLMSAMLG
jgi:hypothetical protein